MDLTKACSSPVKSLDTKAGIVEAYANVYNNEDWDGDISAPGCFIKTVKDNWRKIKVYKNHNRYELIGVPKEMDANDTYGLRTITQFNMNTDLGKDLFSDIQLIQENDQDADLSIGYSVIRRDSNIQKRITEYRLFEYSFLTCDGANPLAVVTGLKGVDNTDKLIKALEKMYNLPHSDTRLKEVEHILRTLTFAPPTRTQKAEPLKQVEIIKQFRNSLILKRWN